MGLIFPILFVKFVKQFMKPLVNFKTRIFCPKGKLTWLHGVATPVSGLALPDLSNMDQNGPLPSDYIPHCHVSR